jgi:serine/threonine protein kinase
MDVTPVAAPVAADRRAGAFARMLLRGRFQTIDEFNEVHQHQCVIKCAAPDATTPPSAESIAVLRREHETYQEVRRLAEGNETGCVRLYSCHPEHHYLVLKDHGADLRSLLKPDLRSPHQVLEAVVSAVHALHSLGIMHGDIKPQNLLYKLFDHGYVVKLCDLDAAHKVGETCSTAALGTAHYHAPELRAASLRGDTVKASLELDMFALGLVMWQVLTRSPHAALDCAEADDLYADQAKLNALLDCPLPYKAALEQATCISPSQRVSSAGLRDAIMALSDPSAQQADHQEEEGTRNPERRSLYQRVVSWF